MSDIDVGSTTIEERSKPEPVDKIMDSNNSVVIITNSDEYSDKKLIRDSSSYSFKLSNKSIYSPVNRKEDEDVTELLVESQ